MAESACFIRARSSLATRKQSLSIIDSDDHDYVDAFVECLDLIGVPCILAVFLVSERIVFRMRQQPQIAAPMSGDGKTVTDHLGWCVLVCRFDQ